MITLRKLTTDKELWDAFVEYIDEAIAKQQEAATELAKAGIRPSTATFSA